MAHNIRRNFFKKWDLLCLIDKVWFRFDFFFNKNEFQLYAQKIFYLVLQYLFLSIEIFCQANSYFVRRTNKYCWSNKIVSFGQKIKFVRPKKWSKRIWWLNKTILLNKYQYTVNQSFIWFNWFFGCFNQISTKFQQSFLVNQIIKKKVCLN